MKITASVYVDQQVRFQYPIEYVTRNLDFCDAIYLFGSDRESCEWLREMAARHPLGKKMVAVEIGVKVVAPVDIASAQNACMEWMRRNENFDYHLLIQADTTITVLGVRSIRRFIGSGDPDRPVVMQKINHIRLHTDAGRTHFGVALIGRDSKDSKFVGDGAYTENYWVSSAVDHIWHAIDIGYLSVDGFARKMDVRGSIWKDLLQAGLFWEYKENRSEFLKIALRDLVFRERCGVPSKMISEADEDYMEAVKHFGLEEERRLVSVALKEVISEGPETCVK